MSEFHPSTGDYRLFCTPDIIVRFGGMAIDQLVELDNLLTEQKEKVSLDILRIEAEIDWKLGVRPRSS